MAKPPPIKATFHEEDAPKELLKQPSVAVDTETMGLKIGRDRLCLVQLCGTDGACHLVRFASDSKYKAPVLRQLLEDDAIVKIFHFARFDVAMLYHHLHVRVHPIYCTRTASKIARTFTDKHGLRVLCRDLLRTDISKVQQSSDWGAPHLKDAQLHYAASDVVHLHALKEKLDAMLVREGRQEIAHNCFDFLMTRAILDVKGWEDEDIFAH